MSEVAAEDRNNGREPDPDKYRAGQSGGYRGTISVVVHPAFQSHRQPHQNGDDAENTENDPYDNHRF